MFDSMYENCQNPAQTDWRQAAKEHTIERLNNVVQLKLLRSKNNTRKIQHEFYSLYSYLHLRSNQ